MLPLGREAAPNPETSANQAHRIHRVCDCCAAEREQAPSPQGLVLYLKHPEPSEYAVMNRNDLRRVDINLLVTFDT